MARRLRIEFDGKVIYDHDVADDDGIVWRTKHSVPEDWNATTPIIDTVEVKASTEPMHTLEPLWWKY